MYKSSAKYQEYNKRYFEKHERVRGSIKICSGCKQEKPLFTPFYCRDCENAYQRAYRKQKRQKDKEWYQSLKKKPCSRCRQVGPPRAMHWHHIDPSIKTNVVSELFYRQRPRKMLLEELDKCELLCAFCHAEVEDEKWI